MHRHCLSSLEIAAVATLLSATASTQVLASYPLASDLNDATTNNGPVALFGNTVGPADGVCVGGGYAAPNAGDELYTPSITGFDETDFQIDIDFRVDALPPLPTAPCTAVLVGSRGWRWIAIEVDRTTNEVGVLYNNAMWLASTTTVNLGQWYWATLKYDNGDLELLINGTSVLTATIGALTTSSDYRFTTTNYGFGAALDGCVRNLVIANDATIGTPSANSANYGTGCGGLTLTTNGAPTIGNFTFACDIIGPAPLLPLAYVAFGTQVVEPGLDLTAFGIPGCFAYTNLNAGIYGAITLSGPTPAGSLPFPIPAIPSLGGSFLTAQAVGFQPTQLATSNRMRIYVGM